MSKRGCILFTLCFIALLTVTAPIFPVVVARNCTVIVIDIEGKPSPGIMVSRGWGFGSPEALEERLTGQDGAVTYEKRVESHSLLRRFFSVVGVLMVHGNAHTSDEYLIKLPPDCTAEINSDAPFQWVYDEGHLAKVDLGGLPSDKPQQVKFTLKKRTVERH